MDTLRSNKIDPHHFDVTVSALLIGLGAEKYIDLFRKKNIGQNTLVELTDEDFVKLGVDDKDIRKKLIDGIKSLPIYEESINKFNRSPNLGPLEIVQILDESSQHLYKIYLSMLANTLTIKKNQNVPDCLLYKDKYTSDIAIATLNEIDKIVNSIDITLQKHVKINNLEIKQIMNRKRMIVGTVGTAVVGILAVLFIRSIKQL